MFTGSIQEIHQEIMKKWKDLEILINLKKKNRH